MDTKLLQEMLKDMAPAKTRDIMQLIIMRCAYLEGILTKRLQIHLADDERKIPARTFFNKIELAYQIGLISSRFRDDLHQIRMIRNDYVHFDWKEGEGRPPELTVDMDAVEKNTIKLINSFAGFLRKFAEIRTEYPEGILGDLIFIALTMECELLLLSTNKPVQLKKAKVEHLYEYDINDSEDMET